MAKPFGIIYLITNTVNGKVYVGQTTKSLRSRWVQHKASARKLQTKTPLWLAIQKYGSEKFIIKELETCENKEALNQAEQKFIEFYQSNSSLSGYNCTNGGDHSYTFTLETRQKLSTATKKRYEDPLAREVSSKAQQKRWSQLSARQELSETQKRRLKDPKVRIKLSRLRKKLFEENPRLRIALVEGSRAYNKSPEGRKAQSDMQKRALEKNPALRQIKSESAKRRALQNPTAMINLSKAGNLARLQKWKGHDCSSPEGRARTIAATKGRKHTSEAKAKIALANKGLGLGRKLSSETKAKMSAKQKAHYQMHGKDLKKFRAGHARYLASFEGRSENLEILSKARAARKRKAWVSEAEIHNFIQGISCREYKVYRKPNMPDYTQFPLIYGKTFGEIQNGRKGRWV